MGWNKYLDNGAAIVLSNEPAFSRQTAMAYS